MRVTLGPTADLPEPLPALPPKMSVDELIESGRLRPAKRPLGEVLDERGPLTERGSYAGTRSVEGERRERGLPVDDA
jgi:hypothetical protein